MAVDAFKASELGNNATSPSHDASPGSGQSEDVRSGPILC